MEDRSNYHKIEINDEKFVKNCVNLCKIDRLSICDLNYNDFFWKYMKENLPVLINSISNCWECSKNWVLRSSPDDDSSHQETINFEYLRTKIPNIKVPIDNCSAKYYNSHEKLEMPFWDFLKYWEKKINTPEIINKDCDDDCDDRPIYYLKDWHLKKDFPDYEFYEVPEYFVSDWLNEYLIDNEKDDYMFVYMGPKGTWTPFHADVFSSFSWSTNIVGRKKWLMLPPGEEIKLKDSFGNLPFSINEEILEKANVKFIEIIQNANEALFVPTGWHHQVWNLEDTISVNHNWFNACNVVTIWSNMKSNLVTIRKEIDNCRTMDDFEEHCQVMLKSLVGLDFKDFHTMMRFILNKRRNAIELSHPIILFRRFQLGLTLLIYDIKILQNLLVDFLQCDDVKLLIELNSKFLDC